jgi:hypothetical protein
MITADVLIMSTSGFSNVPAVFNRHGLVIYSPFWEMPLPHWHVVGNDTMQRMRDAKEQLKTKLCVSATVNPLFTYEKNEHSFMATQQLGNAAILRGMEQEC